MSVTYVWHFHLSLSFFFFNDTATTEIYTLSLHDALPIFNLIGIYPVGTCVILDTYEVALVHSANPDVRSEEHTSELQSQSNLVCRLLLEKKNKTQREPRRTNALITRPVDVR